MFPAWLRTVTGALSSSLRNGTIVERVIIVVGVAVLLYGLVEFVQVAMGLFGVFIGDGTDVEMFTTTLRFFLTTVIGFVTIVLATYLEFGDVDAAGH